MKGLFDIFKQPPLSLCMTPAERGSRLEQWSSHIGYPSVCDLGCASMVDVGWYRLRGQSVEPSGPDGAAIVFPGERAVLRLPFGINGKLDHIFFLPFPPETLGLVASQSFPSSEDLSLSLHRISFIAAWFLMAGRTVDYVCREGTFHQLERLKAFGNGHILAPPDAASRLERVYGRIKQRMVLRSLPLYEYEQWRFLNGAARTLPRPAEGTSCPVTVIVDARGSDDHATSSTLGALARQTLVPEQVFIIDVDSTHGTALDDSRLNVQRVEGSSALDMVETRFMLFLLAGDIMVKTALKVLTDRAIENPEVLCVSCDEDMVRPDGFFEQPVFKPEYDPVFQVASNYIGRACLHVSLHIRSLLFDKGELSTDLMQQSIVEAGGRVSHVPTVLLHCPKSDDRFAFPVVLKCQGGDSPLASIVIPSRDRLELLQPCVESLANKTTYPSLEIIIIDNGSREATTSEYLCQLGASGKARVIAADIPFNYSRLNNLGVAEARGEVLVFLNNDIEAVDETWLSAMVSWAVKPDIGAVGARLLYPDGRIQHAGLVMGLVGIAGHPWKRVDPNSEHVDFRLKYPRTVSANTGACLVVRKDHFESVGGFDESLAVAFNDVDLCLKLQEAGLRNVWTPEATLIHHESVSRGRNNTPEKRRQFESEKRIMRQRWGDTLKSDPYYNPNLTYEVEDGGLALFPRHLYPKKWWQF